MFGHFSGAAIALRAAAAGVPTAAAAAYEAPFLNGATPRPAPDPVGHPACTLTPMPVTGAPVHLNCYASLCQLAAARCGVIVSHNSI